jgi:hypothetical protein
MKSMWLNEFKVALVTKDIAKLQNLMDTIPKFDSVEEMQEALFLINDARKIVTALKQQTILDMKKIKQNINFLEATHIQSTPKIDIMQ